MKVRRILMFHMEDICYNSVNEFANLLAQSFNKMGIEVGFVDASQSEDIVADEYIKQIQQGFDAAIAFNARGEEKVFFEGKNIFESLNVPFFNWVLDHPGEKLKFINDTIKNYHVICLDRDHVEYVKKYFPNIAGVYFIPIGGQKVQTSKNARTLNLSGGGAG